MNSETISQLINLVQYMDSDISVTLKGKEWNLIQSAVIKFAMDNTKDDNLYYKLIKISNELDEILESERA